MEQLRVCYWVTNHSIVLRLKVCTAEPLMPLSVIVFISGVVMDVRLFSVSDWCVVLVFSRIRIFVIHCKWMMYSLQ